MRILKHIAQNIAEKTHEIIDYPISITDKNGYILGSTDIDRLGLFHKPSLDVLKNNRMVVCKAEVVNNILPGVSVPLTIHDEVIGVLGIVGDPQKIKEYIQLVKNQVEMICQEAFRNEIDEMKSNMIEIFVQQIIHYQKGENAEHLLKYAKILDYDLEISRTCILIDIHVHSTNSTNQITYNNGDLDRFSYFQRDLLDYLDLIFVESRNDILSFLNTERFIIIKPINSEKDYFSLCRFLEEKLKSLNQFLHSKYQCKAVISVGDINNGIEGIAESYRNAKGALLAVNEEDQEPRVYIYNKRETALRLLSKEFTLEAQERLIQIIEPLIKQDNFDILASTLIGYCMNNMNISETSRDMYIHRNTVLYRLDKIQHLTSLNTNDFEHCMLLYLAIRCHNEGMID